MKTLAISVRVSIYLLCIYSLQATAFGKPNSILKRLQSQTSTSEEVLISSFNIQIFGRSKSSKPDVMTELSKILNRSQLSFIQEIRDKSGGSMKRLLERVNMDNRHKYELAVSEPLGRSNSTEQYAYLYDDRSLDLLAIQTYPEIADEFEREPYLALWQVKGGQRFVTIGLHARPSDVDAELAELQTVVSYVKELWNEESIIIMGDLNADCDYYNPEAQGFENIHEDIEIWIDNNTDTTVSNSHCSYDRFLTLGPIEDHINKAEVFNFEKELGLSHELARKVSDHYPIDMVLSF